MKSAEYIPNRHIGVMYGIGFGRQMRQSVQDALAALTETAEESGGIHLVISLMLIPCNETTGRRLIV